VRNAIKVNRNIDHMPAVKFFAGLDLDQIARAPIGARPFLDGHELIIDPLFEICARLEKGQFLGFHGDCFAGHGISTFITLVRLDLKGAQPSDLHAFVLDKRICHGIEKQIHNLRRFDVGKTLLFSQQ
jgi:hypothetical protein